MWSVKYTGYQGVVKDYYQRICLRMTAQQFLDPVMMNKVEDLVSAYMLRHILLEIDVKDSSLDYVLVGDQCSSLRDLTLPEEKLVFTCELANYFRENTAFKTIMKLINPSVVLLKRCTSRNKTLSMIKHLAQETQLLYEEENDEYMREKSKQENEEINNESVDDQVDQGQQDIGQLSIAKKTDAQRVVLGASSLIDEERQYVVDAHRGVIRAMCLGPVHFPDLRTFTIDLLHSRECNVYMTIDSFEEENMRGLGKFVKKYERPAPAILTKVLLELGAVVCIDSSLIDQEAFYSDIMRLAHPFTPLQVVILLV